MRALIDSLRADDPARAYALLATAAQQSISLEEFSKAWNHSASERQARADALEEGLRGDPNLGERAAVTYRDGKSVHLLRERNQWLLESALVSRLHAGRPGDAVQILAGALTRHDFDGVLGILTSRRRSAISERMDTFVASLLRHQEDSIALTSDGRAELRWEDAGRRYKIILLKESEEWRVHEIVDMPSPPERATSEP